MPLGPEGCHGGTCAPDDPVHGDLARRRSRCARGVLRASVSEGGSTQTGDVGCRAQDFGLRRSRSREPPRDLAPRGRGEAEDVARPHFPHDALERRGAAARAGLEAPPPRASARPNRAPLRAISAAGSVVTSAQSVPRPLRECRGPRRAEPAGRWWTCVGGPARLLCARPQGHFLPCCNRGPLMHGSEFDGTKLREVGLALLWHRSGEDAPQAVLEADGSEDGVMGSLP